MTSFRPPGFVKLACDGALISSLGPDEQAFVTISLGTLGDPKKKFKHLMPIPEHLATAIKQGLAKGVEESQLRHHRPAYALLPGELLTGPDDIREMLSEVVFSSEEPEKFWPVYAGHVNVQNGVIWFPEEPGTTMLKAVRKSARPPQVQEVSRSVTELSLSKDSAGWDAESLEKDPSIAPLSSEKAISLPFIGMAPNGQPIDLTCQKRSFIVLALGSLGSEDRARKDVMPIPPMHLLFMKGAIRELIRRVDIGNTNPVWLALEGTSVTGWLKHDDPFAANHTVTMYSMKPADFHDSHATNMFFQGPDMWVGDEGRAARLTACNYPKDQDSLLSKQSAQTSRDGVSTTIPGDGEGTFTTFMSGSTLED